MRALVLSVALVLIAGCSGPKTRLEHCHKSQEYQEAAVQPLVEIPKGLQPLDEEARLDVPTGETRTQPTPAGEPCLIEAPDYMDRSPN